jgi:predicted DsbA family dithiol-disulfide isomerase
VAQKVAAALMAEDDTGPTVRVMGPGVHVEIWSDVVCPWCYIGKRRFEQAVADLAGELEVTYTYRAYQLDPTAPPGATTPVVEAYARKFGGPEQAAAIIDRVTGIAAQDGLEFRLDRATRANTLSAHRLLWLAEQPDSPVAQRDVKERLLRAYFTDGLDVGNHEVLVELAVEVGFDRDRVRAMYDTDEGVAEVAAQVAEAADLGITAVPTFVVGGRWSVPGAQDAEVFVQVLRRVAALQADS